MVNELSVHRARLLLEIFIDALFAAAHAGGEFLVGHAAVSPFGQQVIVLVESASHVRSDAGEAVVEKLEDAVVGFVAQLDIVVAEESLVLCLVSESRFASGQALIVGLVKDDAAAAEQAIADVGYPAREDD